jgi:hypothetical protein
MSNISPNKPSFVFGYWRPWNENADFIASYLDYSKDTSLVKYGADTVGKYINQASKEQVKAINQLGQAIGRGMNILSNQMADINEKLVFLNRNMDVQIEQQKLSNLLLQNIAELLRVPDSEKERQHSIELGIKFFVNASKDLDLYADALEELLKAESLMKQDYFVLHRIGCIYLYAEKYINPEKAIDYFVRAAKYASVESDPGAVRLANALTNNFNTVNSEINNSEKQIGLLAADSYEKAAFSAYILGKFSDAVNYQSKALKFNETPQNRFLLAKYQVRNNEISEGVSNLSLCIDEDPVLAIATFKEIDLFNEPEVLNLISNKNQEIDSEISKLIEKWEKVESIEAANVKKELTELSQKSYEIKVSQFKSIDLKADQINKNIGVTESEIDAFITQIKKSKFCTLDDKAIQLKIDVLIHAKDLPIEKMMEVFDNIKKEFDDDKLKIGSKYAGGIIFYIDKTGNHGLVCAEKDFGTAIWGELSFSAFDGNGIADGSGLQNTIKILEEASSETISISDGWFSKKEIKKSIPTAARLCKETNHNGFSDWYLPTLEELKLMFENLKLQGFGDFKSEKEEYGYEEAMYWSSCAIVASNMAFCIDFSENKIPELPDCVHKKGELLVRAVRTF